MTLLHSTLGEPLASEITAALIDLAALTRRAACAAHAHPDAISHEMLERVLALHNIHEEDAHALLRVVPPAHAHIHSAEMTCWITYGLSLNEVAGDSGSALDVPLAASSHIEEEQNALLVLGWS